MSKREKDKDAIVRIKREDKKILSFMHVERGSDDNTNFSPVFLLSD